MATPPDTIATLKQSLDQHRDALKEAQGVAFNLDAFASNASTPMETPAFVGRGVKFAAEATPVAGSSAATAQEDRVRDVLLYKNAPATYLIIIVGTLVLGAGHFILSGVHNVTLLTAMSYALLANLALNFLRGLVSHDWAEAGKWHGSAFGRALTERATAATETLCHAHDRLLASTDPVTSLRVAGGLWTLAVLGRWLSIWSVVSLVFVLAFTLPAVYDSNKAAVQAAYANAATTLKARWDGLLSRKQKLAVLGLGLLLMLIHSAWSTRLVALLLGALAVRCHLKPAEVQRIMEIAEPYTLTVRKQTRRVSMAATDFALRSLGGKAHFG